MKIHFRALFLGLAISSLCITASADTADKVNSWFANMNYATVTAPGVYEGQTARYATFGGISTRAPITQPFNFLNVQTPSISAGCGGIDLYMGGFEAINADRLIEAFRAIGENAQSLAFMLAIRIVTPQFAAQLENIQALADKYLNKSLDSCELATNIVGGTLDMFGATEANCIVARMNRFGEDWHTAEMECGNEGNLRATENAGDPNEITFVKGNIAWTVLMEDPYFRADIDFAELLMNITGTVVIGDAGTDADSPRTITVLEPAITKDLTKERFSNIYNGLLNGSQSLDPLFYYRCTQDRTTSPEGCTEISTDLVSATPNWEGMRSRIGAVVSSIVDKIKSDTPLSLAEQGLVASSSFPLYKYLTVSSAYFKSFNVTDMTVKYISFIAEDVLLAGLKAVVERMHERAANIGGGLSESEDVKEFRVRVEGVITGLEDMREEAEISAAELFKLHEEMQQYERVLMSRLGEGIIASSLWGE